MRWIQHTVFRKKPEGGVCVFYKALPLTPFGQTSPRRRRAAADLKHLNMGTASSKPEPPAPSPLFDEPWRKVDWEGRDNLLGLVKEFRPSTDEVGHVRILLYGPVGAGKSSFINSVSTVLLGRATIPAQVNANTDDAKSFTVEYKTHKIKTGESKEYYPFVFNDIMGLEGGQNIGVRPEDIKLVMKGHVRDGYKFNPVSPLSEENTQYYNPSPSADDKVHLLVCVLNANSPEINSFVIQKMKEIREAARDLGIPQVAIATHIDLPCDGIEKDVKNAFKSKYLKKKMIEFSSTVGIPMNCIFPVRNYYSGNLDEDADMDTLILTSLKHMLNYVDDFLDNL